MAQRPAFFPKYDSIGVETRSFEFTCPTTAFYDWLYLKALAANPDLAEALLPFDSFTDIEFNPEKSLNCQAYAAALYRSLTHAGKLDEALSSQEAFLRYHPKN